VTTYLGLELNEEQADVLANALRLVTGQGVGKFPLPGTHDGAILEGILLALETTQEEKANA